MDVVPMLVEGGLNAAMKALHTQAADRA